MPLRHSFNRVVLSFSIIEHLKLRHAPHWTNHFFWPTLAGVNGFLIAITDNCEASEMATMRPTFC